MDHVRLIPENPSKEKGERLGLLYVCGSALLFGISFVFQRHAMLGGQMSIQPITFTACRFPITTLLTMCLKGCVWYREREQQPTSLPAVLSETESMLPTLPSKYFAVWKWGLICGFFVAAGAVFQQLGLLTVSAGKMSFITGSYVVFVPIFEHILPCVTSRLTTRIWTSAVISVVGMYFLSGCMSEDCFATTININFGGGVAACFLSMFCWVFLLILTDMAVREVDYLELAIVEDVCVSVLTLSFALYFEPTMWISPYISIRESYVDLLVVAVVEVFAVIFSILGQIYISPSLAALLFSTASVYAALGGYIFLGEGLTIPELFGCSLIAVATVIASYPSSLITINKDNGLLLAAVEKKRYTALPSESASYGSVAVHNI